MGCIVYIIEELTKLKRRKIKDEFQFPGNCCGIFAIEKYHMGVTISS